MKNRSFLLVVSVVVLSWSAASQQYQITNTAVFPQSTSHQLETSIAINPTNSSNIIAVAIVKSETPKHIASYYTTNGGTTWTADENFTPSTSNSADPVAAFDGYGKAFVVYQVTDNRQLLLRTSTNGGQTWSAAQVIVQKTAGRNCGDTVFFGCVRSRRLASAGTCLSSDKSVWRKGAGIL